MYWDLYIIHYQLFSKQIKMILFKPKTMYVKNASEKDKCTLK